MDECFSTCVLLVRKCMIQKVSNKFNIRFLVKIKKKCNVNFSVID